MADHTAIIAIALCAICAFTFITCIGMRSSSRSDDPGDEGVEQSIEIRVPAIISFQFRTKRCPCSQQRTNIPLDPASSAASMEDSEPDTQSLPRLPRRRHQDRGNQDQSQRNDHQGEGHQDRRHQKQRHEHQSHQDLSSAGNPAIEDDDREG